jgi:hypothetical protein
MADRLDVAERLAEGRACVEHTQSYVQACHVLGYSHPGLTSHPFQVRDWYDTEDGLDLRALDRDCGQLRAAASAVSESLRMQRAQVAELAAAWTGPGGDAAVRFLDRHCDAGGMVATEIRAAAQRCESLCDNLWYLVDSKVATAIAVDERTRPQRQEWLAAAAAVTTGTGDRAAAEKVVHDQIAPYVDEDIRNDWLATMRSTATGVATSYDMVIDRMAAAPAPSFEFPCDLRLDGPPPAPPSAPAAPAAVTPAAISPDRVAGSPPPGTSAAVPAPAAAAPATPAPDWGTEFGDALGGTPAGDPGGGLGSLGGLAGLASRIVDAMGGLLGPAADQLGSGDPLGADDFDDGDPFRTDETKDADETKEADQADTGAEARPADRPPAADAAPPPVDEQRPTDSAAPAATSAPVATAAPAAAPPPGGPAPPGKAGSTPCEIAEDQLPQAGQ